MPFLCQDSCTILAVTIKYMKEETVILPLLLKRYQDGRPGLRSWHSNNAAFCTSAKTTWGISKTFSKVSSLLQRRGREWSLFSGCVLRTKCFCRCKIRYCCPANDRVEHGQSIVEAPKTLSVGAEFFTCHWTEDLVTSYNAVKMKYRSILFSKISLKVSDFSI